MPSLVHASSRLTGSPGVALLKQSVSEQVNGLVTVSCDFVCTKAKSLQIDKLFYPDAPPPVWPSSVNRDYLLARQLFMVKRLLSQENGLTYVSASYAGGLVRGGSYIVKTQERESAESFYFASEPYSIASLNPDNLFNTVRINNAVDILSYTYMPIVHIFEYVQVGAQTTGTPATPRPEELYVLLSFFGSYYTQAPELGWSGIKTVYRPREYFVNILNNYTRKEDIKYNNVTPSVREVTLRYYIN